MSENKRVALTTLEPQKVSEKVNKKLCKTVRISVILPESNEDKCPEYNYKDQLAAVKRRQKVGKEIKETNHLENGVDPFTEEDDDVRRIALEMEAKYGTGMSAAKKKRKGRKDDYADIGMGYDENDSFIDNTDGYDEIVPQKVTTLHGGFYINCGALEFKTDDEASSQVSSSSSESEDEDQQSPVKKKRVLDTSEESESDTAKNSQNEKKPKLSVKNSMQQAIKKKLFSQNKIQVKKRRPIDPQKKTVKELLREKREDLNMSIPENLYPAEEENVEKDSLKENKKPMSITSVTDAIESVVKQVVEDSYGNNQNRQSLDVNKSIESTSLSKPSVDISAVLEGDSSQDANQIEKRELVKLPENIPPDILEIVNKLKQAALDYKGEGKKKFFTDEVNSNLLSLERKCKVLGKSSRVRVYEHLAYYIKVRRETLVRRAKNLALEDEEKRVKRLSQKLKNAIDHMMPALNESYEQECQKVLKKKFSHEGQSEENKNLKMPRRRFSWNDETKKLFRDIMISKKKCFIFEGKHKDNLEELLVNFLRNSILPLWPEGWMYLNNLKKVFNSMTEPTPIKQLPDSTKNGHNSFKDMPTSKHSNLTITPVSVKTSLPKEDISNRITLTKVTNNDNASGSNSMEIGSGSNKPIEMSVTNADFLKKMFDEYEKNTKEAENKNSIPTNIIKDPEKDYSSKKTSPDVINPKKNPESKNSMPAAPSVLKESEKPRYEKDYTIKKPLNIEPVKTSLKEPDKHRYEKDYTIKKPIAIDSVKSTSKEPEKDYSSKSLTLDHAKSAKELEKPRYEKDYSSKPLTIDHVKHGKESEKSRYEKDYSTKNLLTVDPIKPAKEEKSRYDKNYSGKNPLTVDSVKPKEEKSRYEKDYSNKNPSMMDPVKSTKEEKLRYDKDYSSKNPSIMDSIKPTKEEKIRYENSAKMKEEKLRYEKDYSSKNPSIMDPVKPTKEEKFRYEKDYSSKNPSIMDSIKPPKEDKIRYEKDYSSKNPSIMDPMKSIKEEKRYEDYSSKNPLTVDSVRIKEEKPRYEKEYKNPITLDSAKPIKEEKSRYDKDYSSKKPLNIEMEKSRYEKDYSNKKPLNLDPVKSKQTQVFNPYADKIESPKPTKQWSAAELFIPHSEQSLPTDYSRYRHEDYSKHRSEEKKSPLAWHQDSVSSKHRQEELNLSSDSLKQNRYSSSPSSIHTHHNEIVSKHSMQKSLNDSYNARLNDISKPSAISDPYKQINDMLKMNSDKYKHDIPKQKTPDRTHSDSSKHKSNADSGVIVVNTLQKDEVRSLAKDDRSDLSAVIPKSSHCQLLDFSNDSRNKTKVEDSRPYKYAKDMLKSPELFSEKSLPNASNFYTDPKKHSHKYQDFSSNSSFMTSSNPKVAKSDGDDIQKVMENLRALQKLSCSPVKNDSSTSSPVSVIAYNKNFSSKSSSSHSHNVQRTDSNGKGDVANNFQDDFQKQFINSLSQITANPSTTKPNYRCS